MLIWIKEWVQGIIIAVIIATILEMLLPDNKNKKYISTVIGIYILFSIISPIISKITGKSINIENYADMDTIKTTNYTINNVALLESSSNVEDIYIQTLKEDITNKLKSKGYNTNSIDLKINTDSEKNYGEILGMYVDISLLEDSNVSNIEEVKIDFDENSETSKNNDISEGELNNVKEFLMDTYGIDKNKINIS